MARFEARAAAAAAAPAAAPASAAVATPARPRGRGVTSVTLVIRAILVVGTAFFLFYVQLLQQYGLQSNTSDLRRISLFSSDDGNGGEVERGDYILPKALSTKALSNGGDTNAAPAQQDAPKQRYMLNSHELPANLQGFVMPQWYSKLDNGTCLKSDEDDDDEPVYSWQKRAPYAMVLGSMKAGTQALIDYLTHHPKIIPRKGGQEELQEEHFFTSKQAFVRNESGIPRRRVQAAYAQRFQKRYKGLFLETIRNETAADAKRAQQTKPAIVAKPDVYAIDNTPGYLLFSESIPDGVMCVSPWVKLLAILRNPVDRVNSHYLFSSKHESSNETLDWESWVQDDIRNLKTAGVLQDWNATVDFHAFAGSEAEMLAWKRYIRESVVPTRNGPKRCGSKKRIRYCNLRRSEYPVGRGLYAIQLLHWYQAMDRIDKPRSDLMVLESHDLRQDTQAVYNQVLRFLDLAQHNLADTKLKHVSSTADYPPMPESIRETLRTLYEPYNRRLYEMLGWDNVWG